MAAPSPSTKIFGVGFVGLQTGSWAAQAHVQGLRMIPGLRVVAVVNTNLASSQAAAAAYDIPRACASVAELVSLPEVDVVVVSVKVPHHLTILREALRADKHVYCEWMLCKSLSESQEIAALAREQGVVAVIGTQAVACPEVQFVRHLLTTGFVGEVLSTNLTGFGLVWGPYIDARNAYTCDAANEVTLLTIPVGHTLAAVQEVFRGAEQDSGEVVEVCARFANRRRSAVVADTGETVPLTAPDQVLLQGVIGEKRQIPFSLHFHGGTSHAAQSPGFLWEIHGSEGDLQISAANGHIQMNALTVKGCRHSDANKEYAALAVPAEFYAYSEESIPASTADNRMVDHVLRMYLRMLSDLRRWESGDTERTAPDFSSAVQLQSVLCAAQKSAAQKVVVSLSSE